MVSQSKENVSMNPYMVAVQDLKWQYEAIEALMEDGTLQEGIDYGTIPSVNKPSLWLSGAQKVANVCGLGSKFYGQNEPHDLGNNHIEFIITCELTKKSTGNFEGSGVASCSTMEGRYRFRNASRKCPKCGGNYLIKGKAEYGGGWLCFAKIGGCGTKFNDGDKDIEGQSGGKQENPDLADIRNTVIQMAIKRAYISAVRNATAAADLFTQDVAEELEPKTALAK